MVRIVIICIALALALSNVNATTSTLKSTLYESVPDDTEKNKLPTPIKLLENLATLENEAVAAIYKFNNTIGQTKKLVNNFIKDCFTMDQQGCSSPKAVFWVGKSIKKIKEKFWVEINKNLNKKNDFNLAKANKKIYQIHG